MTKPLTDQFPIIFYHTAMLPHYTALNESCLSYITTYIKKSHGFPHYWGFFIHGYSDKSINTVTDSHTVMSL